jgi:cytochrome P450
MNKKSTLLKGFIKRLANPSINSLELFEYISKDQDFVRLPTFKKIFLINDPYAVYHILLTNNDNYTKEGTSYERVENVVGEGVLTTSGDNWARRRQTLQPFFHGMPLHNTIPISHKYIDRTLSNWGGKEKTLVNITEEMLALTMNISSEAFLGIDASTRSLEMVRMIHFMNIYAVNTTLLWNKLPTIKNLRFQMAKRTIDNFILESLDLASKPIIAPLLSPLLARDQDGNLSAKKEDLLGEAKNFFLAGHETTGNALSWILYLLAKNAYVLAEAKGEIRKVIGTHTLEYHKINDLPYLDAVINEALRLYPPIWMFTRKALAQDTYKNYIIPEGATIQIAPYLLHRHPKYWNQPNIFYPERFLEQRVIRHKCSFIPFGFGPRTCIGRQFAIMNIKLILAKILKNFEIQLPKTNYQVKPLPFITLKPAKHIRLHVSLVKK